MLADPGTLARPEPKLREKRLPATGSLSTSKVRIVTFQNVIHNRQTQTDAADGLDSGITAVECYNEVTGRRR